MRSYCKLSHFSSYISGLFQNAEPGGNRLKKIFLTIFSAVLSTVLISCARLAGTDSGKRDFSALPPAELRAAAEQGDQKAQFNLGVRYYKGEGVEQNYAEAVKWFRKAAQQGDAKAQYDLGVCYYEGEGVEQNYAEAVKWFQKAAQQGNASAQYNLAV